MLPRHRIIVIVQNLEDRGVHPEVVTLEGRARACKDAAKVILSLLATAKHWRKT